MGSLLCGTDLNYVAHKGCIRRSSDDRYNQRDLAEKSVLLRQGNVVDGAGLNRLQREIDIGACLTAIPHCLNGTELSWEDI